MMELSDNLNLVCPIRGHLKVSKRSKDGLKPTEEYFRIEAIKFLLSKGYPRENFWIEPIIKKFGSGGRNSFRSDFAVLDVPSANISGNNIDDLLAHTIIICEVKRDNNKSDYVRQTQIRPMLDFAINSNTIALYWDNIDKRIFWLEYSNNLKEVKEGPLSFVPKYGHSIDTVPFTFNTLESVDSLTNIFDRIEGILHQAAMAPEKRYEVILQLLLAKLFDEHSNESCPDQPLEIQDYISLGSSKELMMSKIDGVVGKAVKYYERFLPNKLKQSLDITAETLSSIMQIFAPIMIIHSKRNVIQTFYMKFAKDLYKWDMAQYFTPTTVTDFIVDIANPGFGEHVADPACGSADFLVAAFRAGKKKNSDYADCIWGVDNSPNAVQVAVLNMVLNGDGKTNITHADSLEHINDNANKYDIVMCNPPFGTRIVEKRKSVLRNFDLGFDWLLTDNGMAKTDKILNQQETGILFLEVCLKQCRPRGRIAIILPNGYLGNRSLKYRTVREWMLKHARIAAIVSLPRFTFKSSGADVSASVVYLEKRETPINKLNDEYCFAVELVERVGWDAGNKKSTLLYKRNQEDGSLIITDTGEPIIDCDFYEILNRISSSNATAFFGWLNNSESKQPEVEGWTVNISDIYSDKDLTLDPKRHSRKTVELRKELIAGEHLTLGELVDFIPERMTSTGRRIKITPSATYHYVEIQDIGFGSYYSNKLRGWELPSRARHFAESYDIFFGSIWGSATKWCFIPKACNNIVVTNGCFRCRMKPNMMKYLPDLLSYLNNEGWGVQMRAFARGSDGLAEISEADAKMVIIPLLKDMPRQEIAQYVEALKNDRGTVASITRALRDSGEIHYYEPDSRPSHIALV